jgi:RimJ/RimL family protein N-acetyltransferase
VIATWAHHDAVAAFVSNGLWGENRGFGACKAVGFVDGDKLVAGVVFHNYEPWSGVIELSAYSTKRKWLTKERLKAIFGYPFDQLNLRACVARISENNTRTLRIWRAFGAVLTPIPDLRANGEAEVVALLKRDTWQNSKFMR